MCDKPERWLNHLKTELARQGEGETDIQAIAGREQLHRSPDESYNYGREINAFTVWTSTRIYFPADYDSCMFVASVPRFPESNEKTEPVGREHPNCYL